MCVFQVPLQQHGSERSPNSSPRAHHHGLITTSTAPPMIFLYDIISSAMCSSRQPNQLVMTVTNRSFGFGFGMGSTRLQCCSPPPCSFSRSLIWVSSSSRCFLCCETFSLSLRRLFYSVLRVNRLKSRTGRLTEGDSPFHFLLTDEPAFLCLLTFVEGVTVKR